jgi:hypothetical protein
MAQTFPIWLDRDSIKEKMTRWLRYENRCFLIKYTDLHECDDIAAWIKSQGSSRKFVDVYINAETLSTFNILQQVANKFPNEFSLFKEFEDEQSKLSIEHMKSVVINQNAGNNLQAQQNIEMSDITQTAHVNLNPEGIKKSYLDSVVTNGFTKFLEDLLPALNKRPTIILFHIQGEGFNSFGRKFCNWFKHDFLHALKDITNSNFKTCILCEKDWGDLYNESPFNGRAEVQNLNYNDVVSATNGLFAHNDVYSDAVVGLDRNIDYRTLKMKLEQKILENQ